ncbi:hypothetical protein AVEN_43903-1 [Araneus ventricosus]|uniref:Uncharacterized protein n=1 Tax=Araneus ventricosus TaxID=182803 RepID=A0A4Y2KCT4_ARAVE|nr:hypothetical protein AVEN_43903-1 [Araneus ventricosus]
MGEQQACEKVCIKLADPFTEALQQVMARIVLAGPIAMNSTDVLNRADIRRTGTAWRITSGAAGNEVIKQETSIAPETGAASGKIETQNELVAVESRLSNSGRARCRLNIRFQGITSL